jgi:hypothetical protein
MKSVTQQPKPQFLINGYILFIMLSIDEFPDVSTFHPFELYRFENMVTIK